MMDMTAPEQGMEMQAHIVTMILDWGLPWWGIALLAIATVGLGAGQGTTLIKGALDLIPRIHAARANGDPRWWQLLMRAIPLAIGVALGYAVWPYGWAWAIGLAGGTVAPTVVWLVKRAGKAAAQKALDRVQNSEDSASSDA
jgi:hypothetical protein